MARWHALSAESRATFWRSLQTLNVTRVVIALVLLLYLTFNGRGASDPAAFLYAETCVAYLVLAIGFVAADLLLAPPLPAAAVGARSRSTSPSSRCCTWPAAARAAAW